MTDIITRLKALIDGDAMREQLVAIGKDPDLKDTGRRKAVLELLRENYKAARLRVQVRFEEDELTGVDAAKLLSHIQDVIIQVLYDYTTSFPYRQSQTVEGEKLGLVAVGGYGRGLMAPGSDVDLLFLLPNKQTPWGESVVEYMLYMLWDLGLKVGHATRTVTECIKQSLADMTIRTSLLEARYIWGDRRLLKDLRAAFERDIIRGTQASNFIDAKLKERDARHTRSGESRYLVEPNIKDGKGGMRDLHTLYWIGKYVYRVTHSSELVARGLFTLEEYQKFEAAEAFFWDVRCQLHFLTGRAEERLSFDRQIEMASRMGYVDDDERSGVESFMTRYFRAAKDVGDLTRFFCTAMELREQRTPPSIGGFEGLKKLFRPKQEVHPDFALEHGRINIADDRVFEKDPVNLMRLFKVADETGALIHPHAFTATTRSLELIDDEVRADPEANRLFLEILSSQNDPERLLRRMNETGLLGVFIPDFEHCVALMQFNMYHHYTVDEHTIRAVGELAKIERGELSEEHPLANEIIHLVLSRPVLFMAIFLHDIGKAQRGDHSEVGGKIARALCPRMGFDSAETDTIAWLVENHLVMSDFAQTRDLSDPKTIEDFAQIVKSPERLRLLLVLTVADIRAVGPGTWNGWKGQLLRQLYSESLRVLSGGHSAEERDMRVAERKEQLAEKLVDWPQEAIVQLIERHDAPYWIGLDLATQERHARMMRSVTDQDAVTVEAQLDAFRDVTQVTVFAKDSQGLFGKIAGAITACGGTIADAQVFTTKDGRALDVFWAQDTQGNPFDHQRTEQLRQLIEKAVFDEHVPEINASRHISRKRYEAFSIAPQVLVDNNASATRTALEIDCGDRPGLLYDVARTISSLDLSISSAHVATFGERAIGVYYVKDKFGMKVTQEGRISEIRSVLVEALVAGEAEAAAAE